MWPPVTTATEKAGAQWVDPDFPHNHSSYFTHISLPTPAAASAAAAVAKHAAASLDLAPPTGGRYRGRRRGWERACISDFRPVAKVLSVGANE